MPTYKYRARNVDGDTVRGKIEAKTIGQARNTLKTKGLIVFSVSEVSHLFGANSFGGSNTKLKLRDKIILTEQLAVMVKSGLSVSDALKSINSESNKKPITKMLNDLASEVEGGTALSEALSKYPKAFDKVYIQMILAGEKSGNLDKILARITKQLQKDADIKSKVRSALLYPAIVSVLMIMVIAVIVVFVIPRLKTVFDDAGVDLPVSTKALISVSDFTVKYWLLIILLMLFGYIGFFFSLRIKKMKMIWDKMKMRVPVFGKLLKQVYLARFSLGFSSLLASGLPILEIFSTTKKLVGNDAIEAELGLIETKVENGMPVASALRESKYFPNMVAQLVQVGEKSGTLDQSFKVIANFYEQEVDNTTRNLSAALEPIIMIVLGIGIALLLVSVLQPMYNLVNAY